MGLVNSWRSGWSRKVQWLLLIGLLTLAILMGPAAHPVNQAQSMTQDVHELVQDQAVEPLAVQWNNTRV